MRIPPTFPSLLVEEGARRLALQHLEDATIARRRVTGCPDPEALHDYRVALRRLRSCLRAYRKQFRSTVSRRSYRGLRRLARGTGTSRDLEVHLAWVGEQLKQVGDAERPGVAWMMDRLRMTKGRARVEMLALERKLFPRLHDRIGSQLASLRTTIPDRFDLAPRTTAAVTAVGVRRASERLQNRLSRIRGYAGGVEIHRARIAAKHLRYLLEPFAAGLPDGCAVIQRLKALQDSFGDVHDAQVFEKELLEARPETQTSGGPALVPGVDALLAALRARGHHAFESASPAWMGPGAEPFFRQVEALADAIPALGHFPEEMERTFLLTGVEADR